MIKKIIMLLAIYNGERGPWSAYELAALQLAGWVEDEEITDDGRIIVNEILAFVGRVI